MDYPILSGLCTGGEASAIVQALRGFGRHQSVPIDLVARMVGRGPDEIRDSLHDLNSRAIVRLDEAKGLVALT